LKWGLRGGGSTLHCQKTPFKENFNQVSLRLVGAPTRTDIDLGQYKACMLASLRSLLPKEWDSAHEVAWTWLWENVERLVMRLQAALFLDFRVTHLRLYNHHPLLIKVSPPF
jgi:hypothetical protein